MRGVINIVCYCTCRISLNSSHGRKIGGRIVYWNFAEVTEYRENRSPNRDRFNLNNKICVTLAFYQSYNIKYTIWSCLRYLLHYLNNADYVCRADAGFKMCRFGQIFNFGAEKLKYQGYPPCGTVINQ